ncbi:MAG: hypothetical protein KBC27_02660 [Rickettsiales bacterium]|nr:hypothetical protein [Rickettsiales bacterium]
MVNIFENDSHDHTKEFFDKWQKDNHKVTIISEDFHNKKRPSIKFLADIRNRYLDKLLQDKQYRDFDLVIMLDMDMFFGFDVRGILDSLAKIQDWDVVCSNGITRGNRMYDAFAFRSDTFPWSPDKEDYWSIIVPSIQKIYNPNTGLVSVHSCFGGMAIYKKNFLQGCRYDSIKEDCEHVYLHQCMREKNKARITMNPTQIVRYSHWRQ